MSSQTIFTCVSPKTNVKFVPNLYCDLPVTCEFLNTVEELYPLLSDSNYHTDFVVISVEMFDKLSNNLDMFDVINTLSTLIKSTVYRKTSGSKPVKRNTKIIVLVDDTTDGKLVKEVLNFPNICSIGWILKDQKDCESVYKFTKNLLDGDYTPHEKVLELLKNKPKQTEDKNIVKLTARQSQILHIIQNRGASNKTIARMLNLSESTVKLHVGSIFKKYGVKNRTQLALFAREKVSDKSCCVTDEKCC